MSHQLALNVGLKEESLFDTFVVGSESSAMALEEFRLNLMNGRSQFYCFVGESGAGKTHLLQAACRYKTDTMLTAGDQVSNSSVYLPLEQTELPLVPSIFDGLEQISLVAIDDVESIFQQASSAKSWELALADLILKSKMLGHTVILSAVQPPHQWPIQSKELIDALVSVISVTLKPLSMKQDLVEALQKRSKKLGFNLPLEVGNFLIKQFSNDLQELIAVLKLLEQASFVEKRRLTLPFVKKVLAR